MKQKIYTPRVLRLYVLDGRGLHCCSTGAPPTRHARDQGIPVGDQHLWNILRKIFSDANLLVPVMHDGGVNLSCFSYRAAADRALTNFDLQTFRTNNPS